MKESDYNMDELSKCMALTFTPENVKMVQDQIAGFAQSLIPKETIPAGVNGFLIAALAHSMAESLDNIPEFQAETLEGRHAAIHSAAIEAAQGLVNTMFQNFDPETGRKIWAEPVT